MGWAGVTNNNGCCAVGGEVVEVLAGDVWFLPRQFHFDGHNTLHMDVRNG